MTIDVKKNDFLFYCKVLREVLSNTLVNVNDVLTNDIIYKKQALIWIKAQNFNEPEENEINVFLLFTQIHVSEGVLNVATMSSACQGHNSSNVAGLCCQ